ncbi:MAG: hypothetical protein LBU04_00725 [Christensenellaceae bacterium]|jgi:hypothetical protein|nr:hypothetical protein [Christensenellaceae bacterium]
MIVFVKEGKILAWFMVFLMVFGVADCVSSQYVVDTEKQSLINVLVSVANQNFNVQRSNAKSGYELLKDHILVEHGDNLNLGGIDNQVNYLPLLKSVILELKKWINFVNITKIATDSGDERYDINISMCRYGPRFEDHNKRGYNSIGVIMPKRRNTNMPKRRNTNFPCTIFFYTKRGNFTVDADPAAIILGQEGDILILLDIEVANLSTHQENS